MTKIDISEWKPFAIGNIFDVIKGTRLTKAHMKSGDIRFIGSSSMNNGCTSLVGNTENMHPANTITVCYNGSVGETFYQDEPFLASDDVNVLYPKFNMNRNIALFIAPLIKAISARYSYVDKWKQDVMVADEIMLPVDINGEPDWTYMDEYMSEIVKESEVNLASLMKADNEKHEVNTSEWKEFTIGDLFDIHPTKAYKKINIELFEDDGTNPVVVNTGFNNGVGGYSNLDCTEKAGTITFTDTAAKSTDSFFYQEKDFIGYPHVQGMYAKTHEWTRNEGLFLNSVIKSILNGRYDFIRKMTRAEMLKLKVKLPAVKQMDGTYIPDWAYMEEHMRSVMKDAEIDLTAMQTIF